MVALRIPAGPAPRLGSPVKRELLRELCQDEEGNRSAAIVWHDWPGSSAASYPSMTGRRSTTRRVRVRIALPKADQPVQRLIVAKKATARFEGRRVRLDPEKGQTKS